MRRQLCLLALAATTYAVQAAPPKKPLTDGERAFQEVLRECGHTNISDAFFFVVAPGSRPLGTPPTPEQEAAFVNSEEQFRKTTRGSSKCWTYERWQRYVRGAIQQERELYERVKAMSQR